MSAPTPDFDVLAGLRARARRAMVSRNRREALDALNQIIALDPSDQDARRNFDDLLLAFSREIESFERKHGGVQDAADEEQRSKLVERLDAEVPHWRGFTEEFPGLQKILEPRAEALDPEVQRRLVSLVNSGKIDEALVAWEGAGYPTQIESELAIMLSKAVSLRDAEKRSDLPVWKSELDDFANVSDSAAAVALLAHFKAFLEVSRWRLKTAVILQHARALPDKASARESAKLISQLNLTEEELRSRPDLSNGNAPLADEIRVAAERLRGFAPVKQSSSAWGPAIFFMAVVAVVAGVYWWRDKFLPPPPPPTPPPGKFWRPEPFTKAENPKPLERDEIVTMPNDWHMVFRRIYLPAEQNPPGNFEFTSVAGKGVVWAPFADEEGRYYLMGKYEVTWGQFAQFSEVYGEKKPAEPACNLTTQQAREFCTRYSEWLGQQSYPMKSVSGRPARPKIPTASEWEFAARGGLKTSGTPYFGKPLPWDGSVSDYDWHAGSDSSGGIIHPIGMRKQHPLGLFDVFGNAREMATGNGVDVVWMMGGDFTISESEMSALLKIPLPALMPNSNTSFAQSELGFRVVMTADPDGFQLPNETDDR